MNTTKNNTAGATHIGADIHVDVAILGAGTAGLGARRAAKAEGASVVMIDPGPFGTTCARVGCMPSKLLIAASDVAHHAREAEAFGVRVGDVGVDGPAVLARVQSERDRFVGFVNEVIEEARDEGELIEGRGTVEATGKLRVDLKDGATQTVHFKQLVVATGSTPFVPPPFRDLGDAMLTNEDIFEMTALPESLLVVGLGVIGLELGQAFHRLGVRTTLIGTGGTVGPISDPEVLASAKSVLSTELDLHPEYELKQIESVEGGVRLQYVDSKGVQRDEVFERVLMAAGRRANFGKLGLAALGIEPDARGRYTVDPDTLQFGGHPVFAAGDVNGLHPLLHEAADDGRIAGGNAGRFPDVRASRRRAALGVVFSDPQIATVGQSYRDLEPCSAAVGEVDYGDQGRARVHRINAGKVRIYADKRTGRLLGAEMFGPRVEHMAHLLAWAVQQAMTVEQALEMPFYHPVLEEGLRTALRDLKANLRHGLAVKCPVSDFGPGA